GLSAVEPKARPSSKGDSAAACFDYAIAFGDGSLSTNGWGATRPRRASTTPSPSAMARSARTVGGRLGRGVLRLRHRLRRWLAQHERSCPCVAELRSVIWGPSCPA